MSISERRKGLRGQQEVQRLLRAAGFELRKLGGEGDALATSPRGVRLHVETKRHERLRLPEWIAQAEAEAPGGTVPVVVFRQSGDKWYACLTLDAFAGMV